MMILLLCPACGAILRYEKTEGREFVAAYCLCSAVDIRGGRYPVRMVEVGRCEQTSEVSKEAAC